MAHFGQQLKRIRQERGLRQKDLADVLRLAQTTIANYEQCIRFPDEATLRRLSEFFGVSFDYLMGRSDQSREPGSVPATAASTAATEVDESVREYLDLVLGNRGAEAEQLLRLKLDSGAALPQIYVNILQPALQEVGRRWEIGQMDVAAEHHVSEYTRELMARLSQRVVLGRRGPLFVGLSASGEQHAIGVRMVSDLLALDGWRTIFLGTNLPTPSILRSLRDHQADLVGISATMPYHVNAVSDLIRVVRSSGLPKAARIVVGGRAFQQEAQLWRAVGADGTAPDAAQAVRLARELLG